MRGKSFSFDRIEEKHTTYSTKVYHQNLAQEAQVLLSSTNVENKEKGY